MKFLGRDLDQNNEKPVKLIFLHRPFSIRLRMFTSDDFPAVGSPKSTVLLLLVADPRTHSCTMA